MDYNVNILNVTDKSYLSFSYPIGKHNYGGDLESCKIYTDTLIEYIKKATLRESIITDSNGFPEEIHFWCRGSSGSIIAALVANFYLEKSPSYSTISIKYIRKEAETSHASNDCLGYSKTALNVVIDDFINSGNTIKKIVDGVKDAIMSKRKEIHNNESDKYVKLENCVDLLLVTNLYRLITNQKMHNIFKFVDTITVFANYSLDKFKKSEILISEL